MTNQEITIAVNYLKNPARRVLIEAEMPANSQQEFETKYTALTNGHLVPTDANKSPYYIWPRGANKWGIELRLYFIADLDLPDKLNQICVNNNRHGYENYNKRINSNDFIFSLFERGFILGDQI